MVYMSNQPTTFTVEEVFEFHTNYGGNFSDVAPYDSEYDGVAMSEDGLRMYVSEQSNQRLMFITHTGRKGNVGYTSTNYTPSSIATSNDRYVFVATNPYIVRSDDYGNSNNAFGPPHNFLWMLQYLQTDMYMLFHAYGSIKSSNYGSTFQNSNCGSKILEICYVSGMDREWFL